MRREQADEQNGRHTGQHGHILRHEPPQHGAQHRARQRGAGVDVLDEDIGRVPGQYIAHDTAADARQQADEHEKIGAAVRREVHGVPDAHDREDAQAERVEQEHRRVEPALIVHQAVAQEGQEEQKKAEM